MINQLYLYDAELLTFVAIMLAFVLDRFVIRRGRITVNDVVFTDIVGGLARFELVYTGYSKIIASHVDCLVVDCLEPTTVISNKKRPLMSHKIGQKREYLLVKKDLLHSGEWTTSVRITTGGCRFNPLYKIFPLYSKFNKQIMVASNEIPK